MKEKNKINRRNNYYLEEKIVLNIPQVPSRRKFKIKKKIIYIYIYIYI